MAQDYTPARDGWRRPVMQPRWGMTWNRIRNPIPLGVQRQNSGGVPR